MSHISMWHIHIFPYTRDHTWTHVQHANCSASPDLTPKFSGWWNIVVITRCMCLHVPWYDYTYIYIYTSWYAYVYIHRYIKIYRSRDISFSYCWWTQLSDSPFDIVDLSHWIDDQLGPVTTRDWRLVFVLRKRPCLYKRTTSFHWTMIIYIYILEEWHPPAVR